MSEVTLQCKERGCLYVSTGVCMDNLGSECPNIVRITGSDSVEVPSTFLADSPSTNVSLPDNTAFTEENVTEITSRHHCNLVLLVGEPECGKSTLYAAIFDKFHKGGCAGYLYAGSRTPIGFEKRCHHARLLSRNKVSKNERTKSFEFEYLHLSVRHKSMVQPIKHLLFADVNGERFQTAKNTDEEMKQMLILKRADHVCFVADGEMLIDKGKRHTVKDDIITILKRATQNEMVVPKRGFHLLITKWDKITEAGLLQETTSFLVEPIRKQFGDLLHQVIRIASRSQGGGVPSGEGIDEFLTMILSQSVSDQPLEHTPPKLIRQFQKFKYQ
jgi:hypothetical protein